MFGADDVVAKMSTLMGAEAYAHLRPVKVTATSTHSVSMVVRDGAVDSLIVAFDWFHGGQWGVKEVHQLTMKCGGVSDASPNPMNNKRGFTEFISKHPLFQPPPKADPIGLARADWLRLYGQVPQCGSCGTPMEMREGRSGSRFWGCKAFRSSGCKYTMEIIRDPHTGHERCPPACEKCGHPTRLREGRGAYFWGCSQWDGGRGCSGSLELQRGYAALTMPGDWIPGEWSMKDTVSRRGIAGVGSGPVHTDDAECACRSHFARTGVHADGCPLASATPEPTPDTGGTQEVASEGPRDSLAALRERFRPKPA